VSVSCELEKSDSVGAANGIWIWPFQFHFFYEPEPLRKSARTVSHLFFLKINPVSRKGYCLQKEF